MPSKDGVVGISDKGKKNPAIARAEKQAVSLKKPLTVPASALDHVPAEGFEGVSVTDTQAVRSRLAHQKEKKRQIDAIRQRNIERREEAESLVSGGKEHESARLGNRRAMNGGVKKAQAEVSAQQDMDAHQERIDQIVREKQRAAFEMETSGSGKMATGHPGDDEETKLGLQYNTELGLQRRVDNLLHPSVERTLAAKSEGEVGQAINVALKEF